MTLHTLADLLGTDETPGNDLVLLHGWGMNATVWDGLPADLGAGLTQHRIELPGHGDSPFPPQLGPGTGALWRWADACLAAAPARAVWLGWSLGGLVALAAALRAPKRVRALIMVTATPRFLRAVDWTPAVAEATLDQFQAGLLADPAGTLSRFPGPPGARQRPGPGGPAHPAPGIGPAARRRPGRPGPGARTAAR